MACHLHMNIINCMFIFVQKFFVRMIIDSIDSGRIIE